MKAPEKLYVDVNDNLSDSFLYGFTEKRKEDDIECTHTDAFIEKAAEWLNNFYNEETHSYLIDEDIDKFIKYMKGE